MPHYIYLVKYTDEGIRNIKSIPADVKDIEDAVEKMGGKNIGKYYLFGEYDGMLIVEFPNDEAAASFALVPDPKGNVWYRTKTIKAFTQEEFADIVSKLP